MGQSAPGARGDLFVHSFIHLAVSYLAHTYSEPGIAQSPEDWTFIEMNLWNSVTKVFQVLLLLACYQLCFWIYPLW